MIGTTLPVDTTATVFFISPITLQPQYLASRQEIKIIPFGTLTVCSVIVIISVVLKLCTLLPGKSVHGMTIKVTVLLVTKL